MTSQFESLLRDFGYLAAMLSNLDEAWDLWTVPRADGPPMSQYTADLVFSNAYAGGTTAHRQETAPFLYGMCLVRGYSLLESYLRDLLGAIIRVRPRLLLLHADTKGAQAKSLTYDDVIDSLNTPEKLLDMMIDRELSQLLRRSLLDVLARMRERFGFAILTTRFDRRLNELSLIRNCIVHNHGRADVRLSEASAGFYRVDSHIHTDRIFVSRALTLFMGFTQQVDVTAEAKHFK